MFVTVQELIDRARTFVDDDHDDTAGWIKEPRWINFANTELGMQYRRWIRAGLVAVKPIETPFTAPTIALTGVLAVLGVAEDTGNGLRLLVPAQSAFGRLPWQLANQVNGPAEYWTASGNSDQYLVELAPATTSNYVVRHIPTFTRVAAVTDQVDVPDGMDERVVLGMAQRAQVKDSSASALLERLILAADTDLGFQAFSRVKADGPRVRRVPSTVQHKFPTNPVSWQWVR